MLEGKSEKLEFQEMSSSPHWKIKWAKTKKTLKKEPREVKKWKNERWMKGQWKMIFHEMILGLITPKHSLGLLILSFETSNPGLHYVPKKSILIECGYLDWRGFFLKSFIINKAVVSFPQPTKKSWSIFHLFRMNFELSSA